jgi:hypothetical protein
MKSRTAAILLLTTATLVVAQFRVENRVNTALYSGGRVGSVRYTPAASSQMLPSEFRYEAVRSGALPSDIRMNYAAIGPNAPGGYQAYLQNPNPIYRPRPKPGPPPPSPGAPSTLALGSVRNPVEQAATWGASVNPNLISSGPLNSGAFNSGPINNRVSP